MVVAEFALEETAAQGGDDVGDDNRQQRRPRLLKAIAIRRHTLIRLHREQIALLRAWREALREERTRDAERILTALLVTVNAIAGGLKNTG
jgi:phosphoenolpyruvate carboxylase